MFDTSNWLENKIWCRERFLYDQETGIFLWNTRPSRHFSNQRSWLSWNSKNAGQKVGVLNNGYLMVKVDGSNYALHRLVFMWLSGYEVREGYEVDHINGIRDDNRHCNLRVVTRSENQKNTKIRETNTSGVVGVHKHDQCGWVANITHNKKREAKMFPNFDDAVAWRKEKEEEYGFHPNHGRK